MGSKLQRFGLAIGLFLIALPLAAHHSRAIYDQQRIVTLEGVVTKYVWANPHVYLYVETQGESGDAAVWALESNVTTIMRRRGWAKDTFAPGDRVTVRGNPARDSTRNMALTVSVTKGDITYFDNDEGLVAALDGSEAPPVRAASLSGIWEVPFTPPIVGTFSNPSSWPVTTKGAEAREIYVDETMNPQIQCIPRTAPWLMIFTGVHEIEIGDTLVSIRTEYNSVERTVHMDLASHDGAPFTHQGHSIGWWEGEVLVVDTAHFADHRSGSARGIPSGPQKHLVERFELSPDRTRLTYSFVLEDPEYLAAPVTGEVQPVYRPEIEFEPVACDRESAKQFAGD
jgi:Family of unknown function (DUF6152)